MLSFHWLSAYRDTAVTINEPIVILVECHNVGCVLSPAGLEHGAIRLVAGHDVWCHAISSIRSIFWQSSSRRRGLDLAPKVINCTRNNVISRLPFDLQS